MLSAGFGIVQFHLGGYLGDQGRVNEVNEVKILRRQACER